MYPPAERGPKGKNTRFRPNQGAGHQQQTCPFGIAPGDTVYGADLRFPFRGIGSSETLQISILDVGVQGRHLAPFSGGVSEILTYTCSRTSTQSWTQGNSETSSPELVPSTRPIKLPPFPQEQMALIEVSGSVI